MRGAEVDVLFAFLGRENVSSKQDIMQLNRGP